MSDNNKVSGYSVEGLNLVSERSSAQSSLDSSARSRLRFLMRSWTRGGVVPLARRWPCRSGGNGGELCRLEGTASHDILFGVEMV